MVVVGDGTSRRILGQTYVPLRCSTVHRNMVRDLLIAQVDRYQLAWCFV